MVSKRAVEHPQGGLGARIKTLRISAGLTQAQLADRAGMTKTGVASWEQGATRPSSDCLTIL